MVKKNRQKKDFHILGNHGGDLQITIFFTYALSEGEMSAMAGASCAETEGIDCSYLDGAYDECPGGDFHCVCGDDGLWSCDCSM